MQSSLVKLSTLDDGPPYLLCCPPVLQGLDALQTTLAMGQKSSPIMSATTEVKCSQNKLLCFQWNAIKKIWGGHCMVRGISPCSSYPWSRLCTTLRQMPLSPTDWEISSPTPPTSPPSLPQARTLFRFTELHRGAQGKVRGRRTSLVVQWLRICLPMEGT